MVVDKILIRDNTVATIDGALEGDVLIGTSNSSLIINEDGSYKGTITSYYDKDNKRNEADVKVTAGEDGFVITLGSIDFSGAVAEKSGNSIVIKSGEAKISDDFEIPAGMTLTVNKGAKLTIGDGATLAIAEKATLNIAGEVSGLIDNNGTVTKTGDGDVSGATILNGSTGTIVNDAQENINISGTIKGTANVYDADQIVTIVGDSVLEENAELVINGALVVNEGVTLTLKVGAVLTLASNAVLDIRGAVVVEGYEADLATIYVEKGTVSVSGSLQLEGWLDVDEGAVIVGQDGVIDVLDGAIVTVYGDKEYRVIVKDSGALNVYGAVVEDIRYTIESDESSESEASEDTGETEELDGFLIENAGTVVFDTDACGSVVVGMRGGAVIDVKRIGLLEEGKLTVIDEKGNSVVLEATEASGTFPEGAETDDSFVLAEISGVKITENVTVAKDPAENVYEMSVSGDVSVSSVFYATAADATEPTSMTAKAAVTLKGFATTSDDKSKLTVAEGLTIGENVTLENKGTLEVTVIVDATKGIMKNTSTTGSSGTAAVKAEITVTGSGSIITKAEIDSEAGINASKYTVKAATTSDKDTYYYTTLDNALAAASVGTTKKIDVLGEQTLTESATLVSGATLNLAGAKIAIGSDSDTSDVVLTVESGATVNGNDTTAIDVKGVVDVKKKTDLKGKVKDALDAGADVRTEEIDERNRVVSNGWAKWTNVYTAMADSGVSVVKLTRTEGIKLDKSLTIPEGKTLDTNGKNVTAEKNVVITVEGTFYIDGSSVVLTEIADESSSDKSASVVVKGLVKSDSDFDAGAIKLGETPYLPVGAYYTIDGTFYMTTVEKAAAIISTVDEQIVTIKGTESKLTVAGDIAFAGNDDGATVEVKIAEITFSGSVSVDNAVIVFPAETKVSGTFANGSGSVALKGMVPATAAGATSANTLSVSSETKDGTAVLTVSGTLAKISAASETSSAIEQTFTVTGAVTVSGITLDNAVVDGTMTVATTSVLGILKVNGVVVISAGAELTVNSKATVLGTVTASPATTSPVADAGVFRAVVLYLGIEESAIYNVGAAASISGKVVLRDYALVAPGSECEPLKDSTYKSTEFYKDGALYVTGYAVDSTSGLIKNVKVTKDNAYLKGWVPEGKTEAVGDGAKIGSVLKVNAVFKTDIYNVIIFADSAVDNLYIEGNLMMKSGSMFTIDGLTAGNVKITYTLKNGYTGTGTFKITGDTGGKASVSGDVLTLAGNPVDDDDEVDIQLQLTGFTASGYAPVTPVTPSEDKDDGLTITDYLLIVLVVLIVIMAIIVAMRLMRS